MIFRTTWKRLDYAALAVSAALAIGFLGERHMPTIEGRLFPVITPAVLLSSRPSPPPAFRHTWAAEATKKRDCEYVRGSLEWYLGQPGTRHVAVGAEFTDRPKVRGMGRLEWQGLVIYLEPERVLTNSYATVRHQCPWRWWQTETTFYISETRP